MSPKTASRFGCSTVQYVSRARGNGGEELASESKGVESWWAKGLVAKSGGFGASSCASVLLDAH
jgi:hypothetical protein